MERFECDVGLLLEYSVSIEQYFVMYYLYTNNYTLLVQYVKNCGKIPTELFKTLVSKGYLLQVDDDNYNQDTLALTSKFESSFIKPVGKMDFDYCFDQFWKHYPNRINDGIRERFLRTDKDVCKNLYKKIIINKGSVDLAKHSLILQCVNYEVSKRKRSGDMLFMRNCATWLRNKSWEAYQDIVEKIIYKGGSVEQSSEEDFLDGI